jgi:uncharacterized membrane protein YfhO
MEDRDMPKPILESDVMLNDDRRARRVYLAIATAMAVTLSLYYVVKQKAFAFVDVGVDTFFQFLPLQIAETNQIRHLHEVTWTFALGLGGYIGSVFYPVQLLVSLFLPDSWQLGFRLPVYWLQLLIAGSFFFSYLRTIGFDRQLCIFGALAYTFSSYAMINGQWDPYPTQIIQLAAYLYFIESYIQRGSSRNAIGAGLTVALGHVFDIYTFSLFTLLYIGFRPIFASTNSFASYLHIVFRFIGWSFLGFLLIAPIQFPNLYYFFDNSRVSGSSSLINTLMNQVWQLNDRAILGSELAGLFGKDLLGTGSLYQGWANYFEAPGFYVGLLLVLCIPQLLAPAASRREKRMFVIGMVLLAIYIFWPVMRYAVNGFGHIAFRVSTFWISVGLLVIGLTGLRRSLASGIWRPGLAIACSAVAVLLSIACWHIPQLINVTQIVKIVAFSALYAVLLCAVDPRISSSAGRILLPVFACELLLFALPAMIDRIPVNSDGTSQFGNYHDGTEQALAFIHSYDHDPAFYRIEKTYSSVFLCDALIQNYYGIQSYFFNGRSLTRFVDSMQLSRPTDSPSYIGSAVDRPSVLNLLGVKYVLSRNHSLEPSRDFSSIGEVGGITIYRNLTARPFAHFYDSIASEADTAQLTIPQRDAFVLEHLVVFDQRLLASSLADAQSVSSPKPELKRQADIVLTRDDRMAGTIATPLASTLLLSMPYDLGWSATLDGKNVELFRADFGLTAAVIPAGAHAFALTYVPPGRTLGIWVSLISACLLTALWLRSRYSKSTPAPNRMLPNRNADLCDRSTT